MGFPYVATFIALLVGYTIYSAWARLDARYPIVGAIALFASAAASDGLGNFALAATLSEFSALLVGAGVLLLLVDAWRERHPGRTSGSTGPPAPHSEAADPPEQR